MNTFKAFWQALKPDEKRQLATNANTDPNYLAQVAGGHRMAGASLMSRLCRADSRITPEMLRPDLFGTETAA